MSYANMPVRPVGYIVPASEWSQIGDNFRAGVPDLFTTAGDIVYATAADVAARLSLGTQGKVLSAGAAAPAWDWLKTLLGIAGAEVDTSESTSSTTFTNLATTGPELTLNCPSGAALLLWRCIVAPPATAGSRQFMGISIDGAAVDSDHQAQHEAETTGQPNGHVIGFALITGLAVGNRTFTSKYKVSTGTAFFADRKLIGFGL